MKEEIKEMTGPEKFMVDVIEKTGKKQHVLIPAGIFMMVKKFLGEKPVSEAGEVYYSFQNNAMALNRYFELAYPNEGKVTLKAVKKDKVAPKKVTPIRV